MSALDVLRGLLEAAIAEMRRVERERQALTAEMARLGRRHSVLRRVAGVVAERNRTMRGALAVLECDVASVRADMDACRSANEPPPAWVSRCVVCRARGATHAVVHGKTAHAVYCEPCVREAAKTAGFGQCPVCRQAGTVVRVFESGVTGLTQDTAV